MHSVIFNKSNNETHNTVQVSFSKVNIARVPAVYFISSTAATASVIATAQPQLDHRLHLGQTARVTRLRSRLRRTDPKTTSDKTLIISKALHWIKPTIIFNPEPKRIKKDFTDKNEAWTIKLKLGCAGIQVRPKSDPLGFNCYQQQQRKVNYSKTPTVVFKLSDWWSNNYFVTEWYFYR